MKPSIEPPVSLMRPMLGALPGYVAALRRDWSPDNIRGRAASDEQLRRIDEDAPGFVASLHDPEARGAPIKMPDGSVFPRLPGYVRWVWDGEFCGSISLRWQPGTASLPEHVLGHVGYAIVPWKRGRGYATRALGLILPEARALGLPHIDLTTDPANLASQQVILANGGRLLERFRKPEVYGCAEGLRFRINL